MDLTADQLRRLWDRDHTVWQDDPTEVADRLGWLDCPVSMRDRLGEFTALAAGVRADGIDHVVLVGMGGSSLYPEVLASAFDVVDGAPQLTVLDSTHPDAAARLREHLHPDRTLVVAASKSGTTIETRSHLEILWADLVAALGPQAAGSHVVAITDPGSDLVALGHQRGFRAVVENPSDIGGRFSALSAFGLVPAALLGLDVVTHLDAAAIMAERCRNPDPDDNPGAALGTFMAGAAAAGRYQLTVLLPEPVAAFGAWIEQLVAESTGKGGQGVLPIVDEPVLAPAGYGDRRAVVAYGDVAGLDDIAERGVPVLRLPEFTAPDLPAEVFRWEFATAVAGAQLGLNPFDQPDVQAAKTASTRVLAEGGALPPTTPASDLLAQVGADDYLAILAYVDPAGPAATRVQEVAARLRDRLAVPVTVGIGPRYLHSTGQFHKGGPDRGVFAVLVQPPAATVPIPGRDRGLGELLQAQAAGDMAALQAAGRRVAAVTLDDLTAA